MTWIFADTFIVDFSKFGLRKISQLRFRIKIISNYWMAKELNSILSRFRTKFTQSTERDYPSVT